MEKKEQLSHITSDGKIAMVDVGDKQPTLRVAIVRGEVLLSARTLELLKNTALPKGDALGTAKVAGIMAAKRTAELIPLCHTVPLSFVDVRFAISDNPPAIHIESEVRTCSKTGVEMEAFVAAQVAAMTIYDMCKAVQKDIILTNTRLIRKSGGKSGEYTAL